MNGTISTSFEIYEKQARKRKKGYSKKTVRRQKNSKIMKKEVKDILDFFNRKKKLKTNFQNNFLFLILKVFYSRQLKFTVRTFPREKEIKKIMKERGVRMLTRYFQELASLGFLEIRRVENRGSYYWISSKGITLIEKILPKGA